MSVIEFPLKRKPPPDGPVDKDHQTRCDRLRSRMADAVAYEIWREYTVWGKDADVTVRRVFDPEHIGRLLAHISEAAAVKRHEQLAKIKGK
jgi:hypothetical protein